MAGAGVQADELLSQFKSVGRDLQSIVAGLIPFQSQACGRCVDAAICGVMLKYTQHWDRVRYGGGGLTAHVLAVRSCTCLIRRLKKKKKGQFNLQYNMH